MFTVYTDGSYNWRKNLAGYCAIALEHPDDSMLPSYGKINKGKLENVTMNVCELMAAVAGLRDIPDGSKVIMKSDSLYVVRGLRDWIEKWERNNWKRKEKKKIVDVKNTVYWKTLLAHKRRLNLKIVHIKAHVGHRFNELCDELAKKEINVCQNK